MPKYAAALLLAFVGAACSSGDDAATTTVAATTTEVPATTEAPTTTTAPTTTGAPTTTETTTTTEATTTTEPTTTEAPATTVAVDDPAASDDLERSRVALLTIDYFPEGWTETPNEDEEDSDEDDEIERRVDECAGLGPDAAKNVLDDLEVRSPDFAAPDGSLTVDQRAALVDDEQTAVQVMTELSTEAVPACLAEAFQWMFDTTMADPDQTDFPPGTELIDVATEIVGTNLPSDVAAAHRVAITIANGDEQLTLYVETWYQRFGRALSQVQFQGVGTPFPQDGVDALTEAVDILLRAIG